MAAWACGSRGAGAMLFIGPEGPRRAGPGSGYGGARTTAGFGLASGSVASSWGRGSGSARALGGAGGASGRPARTEAHGQRRSAARGQKQRHGAGGRRKMTLIGGPHLSAAERVMGRRRAEEGGGPRSWAAQRKKGKGEGNGPVGLKAKRGKRNSFAFLKLVQTIQFKLKFREFKFNLNNKQ